MSLSPALQDLVVERLDRKQIRAVYPLMREAVPSLSLAAWLRQAPRLAGASLARSGILVARRQGIAHYSGAVCYHREHDLRHGQVLAAKHFIALDVLYPELVLAALLSGLDTLAVKLGCPAIRSIVHAFERPAESRLLVDHFRMFGHEADGVLLTKIVSTEADTPE